jgi:hypothetical protein
MRHDPDFSAKQFINPFEFLEEQFNWAFPKNATRRSTCAIIMAAESLFFAPLREEKIRKVLPEGASAANTILGDLRRNRDNEFYLMLAELGSPSTLPPSRKTSQLAA